MKICYPTLYDASDLREWSGLGYFIQDSLRKQGAEVQLLGNLKIRNELFQKIKRKYYELLRHQIYRIERNPDIVAHFAIEIKERINPDCQLVFSPSSIPVALLDIDLPIVIYTDVTFHLMKDYYPEYKKYCRETKRDAEKMEYEALQRCSLAIYSSTWAARSAIEHYSVPEKKVKVVPFGANTTSPFDKSSVQEVIQKRNFDVLKIIFISNYWERKGGDIALEVVKLLNEKGVKTELHLIGKIPDKNFPDFVYNHRFVDKNSTDGMKTFIRLLSSCHFLILPTRADCTPIVFNEANSFGLPCIATHTGGIPEIIHDDVNGFTFSLEAEASEYADRIADVFLNREKYLRLAFSSYEEYEKRLNWDVAGKKLITYCKELVK